jgi:glycogen debranching enzyme
MSDVIQVHDQYYILATASRAVSRTAVLKHDDTFALFDEAGDVASLVAGEQGLYHEGTRYLSRFELRLNGQRPLVLGARVKEDNELFGVDLTNPDLPIGTEGLVLARDLVHLFRSRFLWNATWHERLRLWNYSREPIHVSLSFALDADFADIFEVRGTPRERRGMRHEPVIAGHEMRFSYSGLDHEERWTVVEWSEAPEVDGAGVARFDYDLAPHASAQLSVAIRCERERRPAPPAAYEIARDAAAAALEQQRGEWAVVETSSERYNQWIRRSAADLRMLISRTPDGDYPYAGVPWFSTPFGRDGIITGLQTLWVNPRIARGVLEYLAATQAERVSAAQDAEPGKILHETRSSEMARLGEVPFGQYYGSVDATPLFVVLAGDYFARTHDRAFLERLWPHVERALGWIDTYGDRDGDGFVEYARRSPTGLVQQGWKDSQDSVFHADGSLAEAPIALCEVQAYVYAARIRAATLAETLGFADRADTLRRQAEQLRLSFEERFWLEDESIYALALDGDKRPCRVRSSNAGHCLFGGIAAADRARRVGEQLVGPEMFSGWGIRTLATGEARYNPMSYHNGSIWPHDNGLIAEGLSLYGFQDLLAGPAGALFEASIWMDRHRLPELFCGFHRREGEGPTRYPVACSPQAWSSGVVFQLLQASLRLGIDPDRPRLSIHATALPPFLTWIRVHNLALPFGEADLLFEQHQRDIGVTVLRKQGSFEICVLK